ncbi:MAG TPA: homoprotocatechuate degradation operon regulator HpaR, partial [Sphingomicrobium sp.]|nr:homoprotocatechuate degradation operon regulator HpaR [Sphingomicrobium sp.]
MADSSSRDRARDDSRMRPFERSLPMALLRAREAVMRGFRRVLRAHGLNEQEWRIIRALMEVDQIEIGELAERVFILKPSATRTIKNLQARGLVTRSRSDVDQRRAFIALTDKARELFHTLAPKNEAEYSRITGIIGEGEMQELYELLSQVTKRLNGNDPG